MHKWKSKATGVELAWIADGWDSQQYLVTFGFADKEVTTNWIRLPYEEFIKAFEKVEE